MLLKLVLSFLFHPFYPLYENAGQVFLPWSQIEDSFTSAEIASKLVSWTKALSLS